MTTYGFNDRRTAETLTKVAANRRAQPEAIGQSGTDAANTPIHGEGWIFLSPAGGIPGTDQGSPGTAKCVPYYLEDTGQLKELKANGNSIQVDVWNIGADLIDAGMYVLATMVGNTAFAFQTFDFCLKLCECDTYSDSPGCP